MYKIAIIEEFHKSGLKLFDKHKNFKYEIINDVSENNLINELPKFDGCTLRVSKLTKKILEKCEKLKVISRHGVGYDNVDLDFIKKRKISLLITANQNDITVAEHAMYMMLSLSKGVVSHDIAVRKGLFKKGIKNIQTFDLNEKEMLIIGFGRVGKSMIQKCNSFNMNVKVYDPFVKREIIEENAAKKLENLQDGLKNADFVSLHVPLTDKTKNLINLNNLKTMKKTAIIINTSRGGVINELDLNKALIENMIFGAGIDVFEKEPVTKNNPLIKNKKILLSPHSATFTNECKIRMAKQTVKNIIDFFEKKIDKSMVIN
jgi:D-3-phosphoglycerate dehydrogenase / 2-oxoglutarate reductase